MQIQSGWEKIQKRFYLDIVNDIYAEWINKNGDKNKKIIHISTLIHYRPYYIKQCDTLQQTACDSCVEFNYLKK